MKSFLFSAAVAVAFVYQPAASHAQQALGPGMVKIEKIEPAVIKTPEYQVTGGPQKRSTIGSWLEIEVEFDTKPPEIAELTFNYTAQIAGKLITGSVTHINIPEGRKHYSVMYVAPRSLEKLNGNKPITAASIENFWVTITSAGQVLDQAAAPKKINPPNLPQLQGLMLNKMETPFAPLFFDRYEAVKANVR